MSAKTALDKADPADVSRAKTAFLTGLTDLSWRLASIVLTPTIIGYGIDQAKNTSKYAGIGLIIGVFFGVLFIIKQALDLNKKGDKK